MAQRWYYARGGQKVGPVTSQELRYLAASGTLQPTDLVWVEGNDRGKEARSVVGLFPAANGEGRPEPPPLPGGRVANAGSTQGAVTAGGWLVEKLGNLTETTKAAARLAAAQARKAHLVNVTLRAAYLDLGRDIYATARFRDEFPEQYAEIAEVQRRIEQITSARPPVSSSGSLADRATRAAAGVKVTAQAKALSMKKESLLRQLGESAYARFGEQSGPGPVVHRVADDLLRLGQLDEEILQSSKIGQGRLITSRRILMGAIGLGILSILIAALTTTDPGDRARFGERSPESALGADNDVLPPGDRGQNRLMIVGQSRPDGVDAKLHGGDTIDVFLEKMKDMVESDPTCDGRFPLLMRFDEQVFLDHFGQPDSNLGAPDRMRLWGYRCRNGTVALRVYQTQSIIFVHEVGYTGRVNPKTEAITKRQFKQTLQTIVDRVGPHSWLNTEKFLDTFGLPYSAERTVSNDPMRQHYTYRCSDGILMLDLLLFYRDVALHRVEIERIKLNNIDEL